MRLISILEDDDRTWHLFPHKRYRALYLGKDNLTYRIVDYTDKETCKLIKERVKELTYECDIEELRYTFQMINEIPVTKRELLEEDIQDFLYAFTMIAYTPNHKMIRKHCLYGVNSFCSYIINKDKTHHSRCFVFGISNTDEDACHQLEREISGYRFYAREARFHLGPKVNKCNEVTLPVEESG